MGMFDSLYDPDGEEWQTKAFGCILDRYSIGDEIPGHVDGDFASFQVKVFGGPRDEDALATVRDKRLASVPAERDSYLPLIDYHGGILELGAYADALDFIDQTVYANEDSADSVTWTNVEVLELLAEVRMRLVAPHPNTQ